MGIVIKVLAVIGGICVASATFMVIVLAVSSGGGNDENDI